MRVLHLTPALSSGALLEINNNRASGLGYMVFDIATEMSKLDDIQVDVLSYRDFYDETKFGKCRFLSNSFFRLIKYFRFQKSGFLIRHLLRYGRDRKALKNIIYDYLSLGYISFLIQSSRYDIVHIHGCLYLTSYVRSFCEDIGIPVLITLHGVNSFGGVAVPESTVRYERYCLKEWHNTRQIVTFVSTGCKMRVLNYLGVEKDDRLKVVPNFTNIAPFDKCIVDIRKKYHIPQDAFIILYIGNVNQRKNQKTFVDCINNMEETELSNIYVFFLGRDGDGDESIANIINKGKNRSHMILCGDIPKREMSIYLSQGNATALISYSEGFGLGIIEGFRFGLPALAIDDMDGMPDIYNENAMVKLTNRKQESILRGIKELVSKSWNREKIIEHSQQFSGPRISNLYKKVYSEMI